jgi:carboxyl-terminal processing protease
MNGVVRDKIEDEERAAKRRVIEVELDNQTYRVGVIEAPSFYQDFAARLTDEDCASTSRDV